MRLFSTLLLLAACARPSPPTPAASASEVIEDRFDGDWGGTLHAGSVSLRLVLRIRGGTATLDSLDQRVEGIPASEVTRDDGRVRVRFDPLGATYEAGRDGPNLDGQWTQGGSSSPLILTRDLVPFRSRRPQDPTEPLPYPTEDVTIPAQDHRLACTLALPSDATGPVPGVVLLTGSGPQDRDESLAGHRPFLVLSDHLARHGIASLRCDDRGFAASTGDFLSATTRDFAIDAQAAADWLRARPETGAVGFIGHSEGGMVAPLAAPSADFMVLLAPPAVFGRTLYLRQIEDIAAASGIEGQALLDAIDTHAMIIDHVVAGDTLDEGLRTGLRARLTRAGMTHPAADAYLNQVFGPWFRAFLDYDPAPALAATEVPILALWGSTDLQVDAEMNADAFREATSGSTQAETRIFPGLNHLFQRSDSGLPGDYAAIDQTLDPTVLEAIRTWIAERP